VYKLQFINAYFFTYTDINFTASSCNFPDPNMGRVKFVLNLISFSSSLLGPIFYFYIYVSRSVLPYCSIKHDDDDEL